MRNGQNKRMRGRNRKGQNPLTRIYESNGPDVKIRGTASHVAEKYVQLARDAQASGDPVAAENYFQHAEHYFRMIAAAQEQFRQSQPYFRQDGEVREDSFDEFEDDQAGAGLSDTPGFGGREPYAARESQPYPPREGQPFPPRENQSFQGRDQSFQGRDQSYMGRPQSPSPARSEQPGDMERLPAFITGSGPQPFQGYGPSQNGFEGQPDRFPLHRRRRRRHGPRGDLPGSSQSNMGTEDLGAQPPSGAPPTE